MIVLFWSSILLLAFTYLGYPLCMALRARLHPLPLQPHVASDKHVDVLLVVHNGAPWLPAKIDNLCNLSWPDTFTLHIGLDGCDDASLAIAEAASASDPRIRVHAFFERRGKSACIGDLLPRLQAPLVLFTDVRQQVDPAAVSQLIDALADPAVGAAGGELDVRDARGAVAGVVDAYWRFERWLRAQESRSGSVVGLSGALYMVRREALPNVPPGLILDDMWIPLQIAAQGWRVVVIPGARVYDVAASSAAIEDTRKRRTLAGNVQLLRRWPRLAVPGGHPLWVRLWGHKWLRLFAPWLLLLALVSNLALWRAHSLYAASLLAQACAYGLAALGALAPTSMRFFPIRIANTFVRLNVSAARAPFAQMRDGGHLWVVTRIRESGK